MLWVSEFARLLTAIYKAQIRRPLVLRRDLQKSWNWNRAEISENEYLFSAGKNCILHLELETPWKWETAIELKTSNVHSQQHKKEKSEREKLVSVKVIAQPDMCIEGKWRITTGSRSRLDY